MFIWDSNEAAHLRQEMRAVSRFFSIEALTGADLLITPWEMEGLDEHKLLAAARRGALVQVKRGEDLIASRMDGRLLGSLAKMRERTSYPILLFIGDAEMNKSGGLLVNGERPHVRSFVPYSAFQNIVLTWQLGGGLYMRIPTELVLPSWCSMMLRRLKEERGRRTVSRPVKIDLLLQDPQEATLSTLPGVGPERARALWRALGEHRAERTLLQALCWATDPDAPKIPGWGPKTKQRVREFLGLEEGMEITLERRPK